MDKQLLKALDNLSTALEKIGELMAEKSKGGEKNSDVTKALQSGNFIEEIKEINIGVKSIKKDTEEILKQQKTILEMSKKKESDKKTGDIESDPKKESSIKKGVATILLIAVAVLAIGMAFKIVGKIDFISVIGLGIAIVLIGIAFEKIAKLKITRKEAMDTSLAMVIMSGAVMISSFLLSKISVISIQQGMTAIFIGFMFMFIGPSLANMITAMTKNTKVKMPDGKVIETNALEWSMILKASVALPLIMIGMSIGIALSSRILSMITPITITQGLTALLISGVFAIASGALVKIIGLFEKEKLSMGTVLKTALLLPLVLLSLSVSIWLSSMILGKVQPIGLMQAVSSILIAAIFSVAAFGLRKILKSFEGLSPKDAMVAAFMMPFVFVALSISIWASSKLLGMVQPISFGAFIGSIMIAALFFVLSFSIKRIANAMGSLNWKDIPKIPVFFVLISMAIAASAFILWKAQPYFDIQWMIMLKILALGAVIGILGIIFGVATKIIGNISWGVVFKLPLFFTLITIAVTVSAYILYNYQKFFMIDFMVMIKILVLGAVLGILGIIFGIASKIIEKVSWGAIIKMPVFFTILTITLAISAFILSKAMKFFEGMTFIGLFKLLFFSVILAIAAVTIGIVAKILNTLGSPVTYLKGGLAILIIAAIIMVSSHILNAGKYANYPSLKWILGVGASLAAFGIAAFVLGLAVFGPQALIFAAGLGAILVVAGTIVAASHILVKGKYNVQGMLPWAMSVALLYGAFVPAIIALGVLGLAGGVMKFFGAEDPFEKAQKMMLQIAATIVGVSFILAKGQYKKGPTVEWATGIAIALGAFSPIYGMLMANGVMKLFGGGGVGPDDFAKAIVTVSGGIMQAAELFASPKNKGIWKKAPTKEWAEGVGIAIGAFAPVLSILSQGSIVSLFGGKGVDAAAMKGAIIAISEGIVEAARYFGDPTKLKGVVWSKSYPAKEWGEGVGAALNAFAPVFAALQGKGWFTSGKEVIAEMKMGILQMSDAIVKTAQLLNGYTLGAGGVLIPGKTKPDFKNYPTKEWGQAIGTTVIQFNSLFGLLSKQKGGIAGFTLSASLMNAVFTSVTNIAIMIKKAEQAFKATIPATWIANISVTAIGYANLVKQLEALLTTTEKKTKVAGLGGLLSGKVTEQVTVTKETDVGIVARTVASLVQTAKILYTGRKFFEMKIDPNYMKNVGSNILAFAYIAQQFSKMQQGGGIGGMFKRLVGQDPISQMASGMVKIALAYDILARSLQRFGNALSSIDGEKVSIIRRLTGNIAVLASMDAEMFDRVMSVMESRASVFSKLIEADKKARPSVGDRKGGGEEGGKKAAVAGAMIKKSKTEEQLDKIIEQLKAINYNTSGIDEWLASQDFGPDSTLKL